MVEGGGFIFTLTPRVTPRLQEKCEKSSRIKLKIMSFAQQRSLEEGEAVFLLPGFSYAFTALQNSMGWEMWDLLGKRK